MIGEYIQFMCSLTFASIITILFIGMIIGFIVLGIHLYRNFKEI